jgi:hypothetical protein
MSTPISSLAPYCSTTDFQNRFDVGDIGRWISENPEEPVSVAEFATNKKLLAALNGASGDVEAACLVGERYMPGDLAALNGNSLDFLRDIVAWLAFDRLTNIHPYAADHPKHYRVQWAEDVLQKLRDGIRIFAFQEQAKAGITSDAHYLTQQDLLNRKNISVLARPYFGQRSEWLVGGGTG